MKKNLLLPGLTAMAVLFFTNCQTKFDDGTLSTAYLEAQNNLNTDYTQAKSFNDSVSFYHMSDSTMESGMCSYNDSLYHYHDSLFSLNYNLCIQLINDGNMMSGNIGMMCANSGYMYEQQKNNLAHMLVLMIEIRRVHKNYDSK